MKKTATTTTKASAPVATEATTSKNSIREFFQQCTTLAPQVFTWTEFKAKLTENYLEIETRYLVTFETLKDWQEFTDLVAYDRKTRKLPGNRDEKPGHAKTLKEKDIPTLASFDYRRGQHSINVETMNLIDAGHRTRVLDDLKTANPDEPLTLALRFTTATAEGFDGTQAKWTVADQMKTSISEDGDYTEDQAKFYAKFCDMLGKTIRLRLQGLSIEGGGQSAHKQSGHVLTPIQEKRLWDFDPLYIGLWNLTAKDATSTDTNPTSTTGRTLIEIVEDDILYTQNGKDLQKARVDLILLALVDAVPEAYEDRALLRKLLDRFETQLSLIGNAYQPLQTFKHSTEAKYLWFVALWRTLRANHAPKADSINEHLEESYPDGLPKISKRLKTQREEALQSVLYYQE